MSTEETVEKEPEPQAGISKCDACKAVVIGFEAGLIIGGAILAAPEEITISGIIAGLTLLGLVFTADKIRAWIKEAIDAGIKGVTDLAAFICKKTGSCS